MIIEIIDDDMDLFNYESDQIRRQQCKMFQDLWGVNIVFNYSKKIKESIARGAKIYDERHPEPIDPIGHYEDKAVKMEDIKISISNTNLAKYRKILLDALDAHEAMTGQTDYDKAFHQGMQHALTILDNFCNDAFKAACVKALNKKFGGAKNDT